MPTAATRASAASSRRHTWNRRDPTGTLSVALSTAEVLGSSGRGRAPVEKDGLSLSVNNVRAPHIRPLLINNLAERGGFEPPVQVYPAQQISNPSGELSPRVPGDLSPSDDKRSTED